VEIERTIKVPTYFVQAQRKETETGGDGKNYLEYRAKKGLGDGYGG